MNAQPNLPENVSRLENGVLSKADVLAIFQPLSNDQVRAFGLQVDEELIRLEERFAHFTTAKSRRRSFGR